MRHQTAIKPRSGRGGAIRAVHHAIQVLNTMSVAGEPLGVTEIAAQIKVHKSTASRILKTLESARLVERDSAAGRFKLGVGVIALAAPLLVDLKVAEVARPYLEDLAKRSGETINLSIWVGDEAVSIEQALGSNAVRHFAPPGRRNPGHATATGKAFLAHAASPELERIVSQALPGFTPKTIVDRKALLRELEDIRARGYAINDGEFIADVSAVAVPIRDIRSEIVGVVTATVPSYRFKRERRAELIEMMLGAAAELSGRLGYAGRLLNESPALANASRRGR